MTAALLNQDSNHIISNVEELKDLEVAARNCGSGTVHWNNYCVGSLCCCCCCLQYKATYGSCQKDRQFHEPSGFCFEPAHTSDKPVQATCASANDSGSGFLVLTGDDGAGGDGGGRAFHALWKGLSVSSGYSSSLRLTPSSSRRGFNSSRYSWYCCWFSTLALIPVPCC